MKTQKHYISIYFNVDLLKYDYYYQMLSEKRNIDLIINLKNFEFENVQTTDNTADDYDVTDEYITADEHDEYITADEHDTNQQKVCYSFLKFEHLSQKNNFNMLLNLAKFTKQKQHNSIVTRNLYFSTATAPF